MKRYLGLLVLLICLPIIVLAQAKQPEPRSGHDLVWDDALGMVLLVNGDYTSGNRPGMVWGWDGEQWQIVSNDAPPIESLGGVAYDTARDVLLQHGGSQGANADDYSDATWTWDGDIWTQAEGENPGARDHFSMVYDAARDQIVMYGGQFFPTSTFYHDTWVWDGESWAQAATDAPDIRYHYAMAYDSARQEALIFGGTTGRAERNDLWAWNGNEWSVIDTGTGPLRRSGARMAFDEQAGVMVLFGGRMNQRALSDTWLWDGGAWTQFDGDTAPPARSHHAMVYDRNRHKIVLFGGYSTTDNLGDTWEWDAANGWLEAAG